MKTASSVLVVLGLFFASAPIIDAQPTSVPTITRFSPSAADVAWQALLDSRKEDSIAAASDQRVDAAAKRATRFAAAAVRAREFYTNHPEHPQAAEARRLEILSLVQTEENGDSASSAVLEAKVSSFRNDTKVPAQLRALGAGAFEFSRAVRNASSDGDRLAAIEKAARALIREFPAEAPGYEVLLAVAQALPVETSRALVAELSATSAPESLKEFARTLRDRYALVGRRLTDQMSAEVAGRLAAMRAGEPIIVYSWASSAPGSVEFGKMVQARRFNAVAVCLDTDIAAAKTLQKKYNLGGEHVFDEKGTFGAEATRLKYSAPGQIYLVDADGVIRDVRGCEDLERKLRELGFKSPVILQPASSR